jgi:hypothetical protein
MTELTQTRPGGKSRLADDVVTYLRSVGREDLIGDSAEADALITQTTPDGNSRPADGVLEGLDFEAVNVPEVQAEPKPRWRPKLPAGKSVTSAAFALLLVAVQCVIQAESWRGLAGFGRLIHITGIAAQGVPVTLDGVSTIAALLALRAELADEPSGRERGALYLFTLASASANYWHGTHDGGIGAALYFGGMSLAVTFVFDMLLRQIRRAMRRRGGRRTTPLPQFGLVNWVRYPRMTFRALSLSIRDGHTTPQAAIDAARAEAETKAITAMDLPVLPIGADVLAGMSAANRLAVAFGALGRVDVPAALALLKQHGAAIDSSHAYKVRSQLLEGGQS